LLGYFRAIEFLCTRRKARNSAILLEIKKIKDLKIGIGIEKKATKQG